MTTINFTAIIADLLEQGLSADLVKITLVSEHGVTLNKATNEYAKYARATGLSKAVVSYKADALEWLEAEYDAGSWDALAVKHSVIELTKMFTIAESTARDYTKAFSKQLGVTQPTEDPRAMMFEWLKSNHGNMEVDELKAEFKEFGKSIGRSPSNINEYWKGYEFHLFMIES